MPGPPRRSVRVYQVDDRVVQRKDPLCRGVGVVREVKHLTRVEWDSPSSGANTVLTWHPGTELMHEDEWMLALTDTLTPADLHQLREPA